MRNRFDYISKHIGQKALGRFGKTVAQAEITTETQYADLRYEPDPARHLEAAELGLLGRFATHPCLIEVYSEAPSPAEFRACLVKHLTAWQQRARDARRDARRDVRREAQPQPEGDQAPFLWIIAAGTPTTLLATLSPTLASGSDWPAGVYFVGASTLRVAIIAASELPRDPSTLLVRLMAGGPLLAPAIQEVAALPATATARVIAEPVLLQLQRILGEVANPEPDEQEFIMAMIKSWEEGRQEARQEARQEMLLQLLRQRFGNEVDAQVEARVASSSIEQLKAWTERLLSAPTLSALLAD